MAIDPTAPRSHHVSDSSLQPFLAPTFDPTTYLNNALPPLSLSAKGTRSTSNDSSTPISLADLSAQTQTLLSQLNAQTTRLSTVLTQLTDDILRSGGRLAYEVELLRGEITGLTDLLTEGLRPDIERFVPGGLHVNERDEPETPTVAADSGEGDFAAATAGGDQASEPEHISRLKTLTLVRSRLESVIKVFGEAMQWTLPPSEVSFGSSLISVSAPEPGSENHTREEKGQEFAEKLRAEIAEMVTGPGGEEEANKRIEALRELATVWKGTAEEKARTRFVEGLAKLAEEKAKAGRVAKGHAGSGERQRSPQNHGGGGFLEGLQRMRGNIYAE